MDWTTLIATGSGAVIALAGTVVSEQLRHRRANQRSRESRSRDVYVQFIVAAGACHTRLREITQLSVSVDRAAATQEAFTAAGIYPIRERLFIDASDRVAAAGQALFERLRAVRKAVEAGAAWSSVEFHEVYHPYLDAAWNYRAAVRSELGSAPISPEVFGWVSLNGAATCPVCRTAVTGAAVGPA